VTSRGTPPDVLVVEGLALFREVDAHYLARVATVRTAGSAAAAAGAIRARRPQLVVSSLELPDRPGEEFVRELSQPRGAAPIPVVVMTRGSAEEHARAVRAGACDVLTRPFSHETLAQTVERFTAEPPSGLPRARLASPVTLRAPAHSATGTLRNLSRGGCFVESRDWLPGEGDELQLDFGLPGLSTPIAVGARLVWRRLVPGRAPRGAGFRFLDLDGTTARALAHFVDASRLLGAPLGAPSAGS
jgi:CheY-like chemotaxis protein